MEILIKMFRVNSLESYGINIIVTTLFIAIHVTFKMFLNLWNVNLSDHSYSFHQGRLLVYSVSFEKKKTFIHIMTKSYSIFCMFCKKFDVLPYNLVIQFSHSSVWALFDNVNIECIFL